MPTTTDIYKERLGQAGFKPGGTFVAPTRTPTYTPLPSDTPTPPVNRTPSLLEKYRKEQLDATTGMEDARREAERYAATQRQARIDAINQVYAPRIKREEEAGAGRMSKVASIAFKSGIIGSGADTTKFEEQRGLNDQALKALEAERGIAIQEALDKVDALARQKAEDLYKEKTLSAEARVKYYGEKAQTALDALKTFSQAGSITSASDLKGVDENTYNTLRETSGMSDAEIDSYLKINAPTGTYQWSAAQIKGSQMTIPKVVNGKITWETMDLGFTPDKEIKTTEKIGDQLYLIYGDGTYKTIGVPTDEGGWGEISNADRADIENYLRTQKDFSPSDLEKVKTDRTFQAKILKEVEKEKASFVNPF